MFNLNRLILLALIEKASINDSHTKEAVPIGFETLVKSVQKLSDVQKKSYHLDLASSTLYNLLDSLIDAGFITASLTRTIPPIKKIVITQNGKDFLHGISLFLDKTKISKTESESKLIPSSHSTRIQNQIFSKTISIWTKEIEIDLTESFHCTLSTAFYPSLEEIKEKEKAYITLIVKQLVDQVKNQFSD